MHILKAIFNDVVRLGKYLYNTIANGVESLVNGFNGKGAVVPATMW